MLHFDTLISKKEPLHFELFCLTFLIKIVANQLVFNTLGNKLRFQHLYRSFVSDNSSRLRLGVIN